MTFFDVMMPYWGDVDQLKAAVRSVLGQRHSEWRLVVIDDGYPDPEPQRWFEEIADKRLLYIRNEVNLGALNNYRKALDLITSDYFVMMGCDDVMLADFLSNADDCIRRFPDLSIYQPGVLTIDELGRGYSPLSDRIKLRHTPRVREPVLLGGETLAHSLTEANWAYFPSVVWRTEAVKRHGFREGLNVVLDFALLIDVIVDGGTMVYDPRLAFLYRRHSQSDSSLKALNGTRFVEERTYFAEQGKRFRAMGWNSAARAARLHITSRLNAISLAPKAAKHGDARAVWALLRHAMT